GGPGLRERVELASGADERVGVAVGEVERLGEPAGGSDVQTPLVLSLVPAVDLGQDASAGRLERANARGALVVVRPQVLLGEGGEVEGLGSQRTHVRILPGASTARLNRVRRQAPGNRQL